MSQEQTYEDQLDAQTESQAAAAAHQVGIEQQARDVHDRKHNPQFYDKYVRSSLEKSGKWSRLTEKFAPWLADDHILSNRRQVHRLQRQLLDQVRAEQSIAGHSPGLRLRNKPLLNALAQGVHPKLEKVIALSPAGQQSVQIEDMDYREPMNAEEKTVMDDIAAIATARSSRGVDQAGSEALTTATTESRTVREEQSEESRLASVSEVFD